ncbi:putative reverse transcriptase zinc-binding domain-containing protein [Helianthus annuus]|nr:putative reverse transcriptase zinc-binding domain-containing protein [Helianthus annuus]
MKTRFPAVFALAKDKEVTVSQSVRSEGGLSKWSWDWSRKPGNAQEKQQYEDLLIALKDRKLVDKEDVWQWKPRKNELISVLLLRDEMLKKSLEDNDVEWGHWNKWVPSKVNLFTWRAAKNRIAAKVELIKRGVQLENQVCSRCKKEEESVNHLLLNCLKSRAIWRNILIWLKLPIQLNSDSCGDLLEMIEEINGSKEWKKLIKAIFMITIWQIWKYRNDVEFNKKEGLLKDSIDDIKELSFLWIKERSRLKNLVWERWKDFNIRDVIK